MRPFLACLPCLLLAALLPAGCALVTVPEPPAGWADARMAEEPDREPPAFVPEIPRPAVESWRMASAARQLADTRDVVAAQARLLELPPVDPLTFGQRAREQAAPPPAPPRRN